MNFFARSEHLSDLARSGQLSPADLDEIVAWPIEEMPLLFAAADRVRRHFFGDQVGPCTLANIKSGACSEDCAFCSQSAHHATGVAVTELMPTEEIRAKAEVAARNGLPFCVVASGRRLDHVEVAQIAEAIRPCACEKHASLGILDESDFALLRDAGVVYYNHNVETARSFFPSIVSTHAWEDRVATVTKAKAAGMRVCCGGIFGLGESWEQRKEMCLELREIDVDTVPINFLIEIPGTRSTSTPRRKEPAVELLKIVSLFRLGMPSKRIQICGGREADLGPLQSLIFYAGANGYVTGGYLTTPGAGIERDDAMVGALGLKRKVVSG